MVIVDIVTVPFDVVRVVVDVIEVVACAVISIVEVAAITEDVDVGQSAVLRSVTVVVAWSRPRFSSQPLACKRAFRSATLCSRPP